MPKFGPFLFAISLRKGPFLETAELPMIFIKISENRGQSTTVWRDPTWGPNRGWVCPIFVIILAIASLTCFVPTFGQFLFAIRYRQWSFSETGELPMIFIKFRKIAGNLPLFGEALFRTLIAAGGSSFSASFQPSPRGPVLFRNVASSFSRLASVKGHFWRQMNRP